MVYSRKRWKYKVHSLTNELVFLKIIILYRASDKLELQIVILVYCLREYP